MITAEQIAASNDFEVSEPIPAPQWAPPGTPEAEAVVYVRTMTAGDRDRFVQRCIDEKTGNVRTNVENVTATLLAMTLCNAGGDLLFPDLAEGKRVLTTKSALVADKPFTAAMKLNGLGAADIEDLTKN